MPSAVSFVVPVKNGERWIAQVLAAILIQAADRTIEVIVVEDGSTDASLEILQQFAKDPRVLVLQGEGRGAAAAINLGFRTARFALVAQVDQDVVLRAGWLDILTEELAEPTVGGAQGYYETDRKASIWARIAGYDLERRYQQIKNLDVDHICTGNSVYRTDAVELVGPFNETIGYGYDNDMSYRLIDGGYRLRFAKNARSVHCWRENMTGYLKQQYGQGYGRLDLVVRHPRRVTGDRVSGLLMILHVPGTFVAVVGCGIAATLAYAGGPWHIAAAIAAGLVAVMFGERLVAAVSAARQFKDPAALLIAPAHMLRNLAWISAATVWGWRRLFRRDSQPSHSMQPRKPGERDL